MFCYLGILGIESWAEDLPTGRAGSMLTSETRSVITNENYLVDRGEGDGNCSQKGEGGELVQKTWNTHSPVPNGRTKHEKRETRSVRESAEWLNKKKKRSYLAYQVSLLLIAWLPTGHEGGKEVRGSVILPIVRHGTTMYMATRQVALDSPTPPDGARGKSSVMPLCMFVFFFGRSDAGYTRRL
jgi:hypothetical protein